MHELGGFDPSDAKRVLSALEARDIPFEIESDHSDLLRPGRTMELVFGMYPAGSKLLIFVPESRLPEAQQILGHVFPT